MATLTTSRILSQERHALSEELKALEEFVDGSLGFVSGKLKTKKGDMKPQEFAAKRQMLLGIKRIGKDRTPTSPEDLTYHVFNEQLQRIADKLSIAIETAIHGNEYEILDQFSQAWDRFLYVYKDLIVCLKSNLVLAPLPGQVTTKYSDPKTDFRVLGIKVFTDTIGAKYQTAMCNAVCKVFNAGLNGDEELSTYYPSIRSCIECLLSMADVSKCFTVPGEKITWREALEIEYPANPFVLYSMLEEAILKLGNDWFLGLVHGSIRQSSCLDVLEVANSSVEKLRDMSHEKRFCLPITQPKMLALLKTTFITPVGSSDAALRDRILSMDDGFEFLLKNRSSPASLEGVSKIYNLCTGRNFSPTYDTDPEFASKLAKRFGKFLSATSKAAAFSHPSVPPRLTAAPTTAAPTTAAPTTADHFDVFDDTFRPQSAEGVVADGSLNAEVSFDSDAYNAFLRSDGLTGELSAMKNNWLRRMRCEIANQEVKYKKLCESVISRQSMDPDLRKADQKLPKDKFDAAEMKQEHEKMSFDTEEGNSSMKISVFCFKAIKKFLIQQAKKDDKSIVAELVVFYKELRVRVLEQAFERDAVILKVAEEALTAFMDTPLKFGAVCIEATKEEWRLTWQWERMLADHINFIITNPSTAPRWTPRDELDRTLDLIVLLSNKLAFINYHKRHLDKRLLNPVKGNESYCRELENVVISRMGTVCNRSLLSYCTMLLFDHDCSNRISRELLNSNELEQRKASLAPVEDFDVRYLSKRVCKLCNIWYDAKTYAARVCAFMCGFRYDNAEEWVYPKIKMPPVLERCIGAFDEFRKLARPLDTLEWQPVFSECRVELYFNNKKVSITCEAVVATILSLFETPETKIKLSDIESRTGVHGRLLSAVMEQLCTIRPREGMSTGLLQENEDRSEDEDAAYRFHPKFKYEGKDFKFRIEIPSEVKHSIRRPLTDEINGIQEMQIKGAIQRVIKLKGTSPPQYELFLLVKIELLGWFPLKRDVFDVMIDRLLSDGKIIRVILEMTPKEVSGFRLADNPAAGGAAAGGN